MINHQYEVFLKVAELGSFKKAADSMGYTQAGISYMMSTLENDLDIPLFVRNYGGVALTSEGQELLPYIKEICNTSHTLQNKINELKNLESGSLRICVFTSIYVNLFPGLLKSFVKKYPNVDVEIKCCNETSQIMDMVKENDVDCAFVITPTNNHFYTQPLLDDPLYVILSKDHPLAAAPYFPISALKEYPYVKLSNGIEIDAVFKEHNITPNIKIISDNDYAIMAMVSENFGYGIQPELLLRNVSFPLTYKKLEKPAYRTVSLATKSKATASSLTLAFMKHSKEWIEQTYTPLIDD